MSEPTQSFTAFDAYALFQLLRDGKTHTRTELAKQTGLARSTIGTRVDELLGLGLIREVPRAPSMMGRPPTGVALNPAARIIIAADIGTVDFTIAVTDLLGTVLAERVGKFSIHAGPERTMAHLIAVVRELLPECGRTAGEIAAVGIGLPLPVLHRTGTTLNPTDMPEWQGFKVAEYIQRSFQVPVLVDNDANLMVLGERVTNWPDVDDLLLIKASTGIGSGIISNGLLQRGSEGTAGAIGHMPISRAAGVPCSCGKEGCLVAVAGGAALAASLNTAGLEAGSVDDVVALAQRGNLLATRTVRQAGRDIGEVVSTCISLLNPAVVVIAGTTAGAGQHLLAGVREAVFGTAMPLGSEGVTVALSPRSVPIGLKGASIMAIEHALSDKRLLSAAIKTERSQPQPATIP